MENVTGHDVALLGLAGFRVLSVVEDDAELVITVETGAEQRRCPACGGRAMGKGRRTVTVRDLPMAGRPVRLRWRKRRLACPDAECPRRSWSETHPEIRPRRVLTERARREACRRVGQDASTVAQVARDFGVSWPTIWAAVVEYGTPLVDDLSLDGVTQVGFDEHRWRDAWPEGKWAMVVCDLAEGRVVDVLQGRSSQGISAFLDAHDPDVLDAVEVVSFDPWRGYLRPVRTHLPGARIVLDCFHVIRLANQVVTEVRRRTQWEILGRRGRKGDPLYGIRHTLLKARQRLTPRDHQRLTAAWTHPDGDRWDEVRCAWWTKEHLRDVYGASTVAEARRRLQIFYAWTDEVAIDEVSRLARTVRLWEPEILAYHTTAGASNSRTEAHNLIIEKLRRLGHGYRNFTNYRLRLLLHTGVTWHTPRTVKSRAHTRRPPMVA